MWGRVQIGIVNGSGRFRVFILRWGTLGLGSFLFRLLQCREYRHVCCSATVGICRLCSWAWWDVELYRERGLVCWVRLVAFFFCKCVMSWKDSKSWLICSRKIRTRRSSIDPRRPTMAHSTKMDNNRPNIPTREHLPRLQLPRLPSTIFNSDPCRRQHNSSLLLLATHCRSHGSLDGQLRRRLPNIQCFGRSMVQDRTAGIDQWHNTRGYVGTKGVPELGWES